MKYEVTRKKVRLFEAMVPDLAGNVEVERAKAEGIVSMESLISIKTE